VVKVGGNSRGKYPLEISAARNCEWLKVIELSIFREGGEVQTAAESLILGCFTCFSGCVDKNAVHLLRFFYRLKVQAATQFETRTDEPKSVLMKFGRAKRLHLALPSPLPDYRGVVSTGLPCHLQCMRLPISLSGSELLPNTAVRWGLQADC
jgi:hypothetical protein